MPCMSPISLVRAYSFCWPSAVACRTGMRRTAPPDVRQIESVVGNGDADASQRLYHLIFHGKKLLLHSDFEIYDGDARAKLRMCPEEFILARYFANADGDNSNCAGTFDPWKITAQRPKFQLLLIEFFGSRIDNLKFRLG